MGFQMRSAEHNERRSSEAANRAACFKVTFRRKSDAEMKADEGDHLYQIGKTSKDGKTTMQGEGEAITLQNFYALNYRAPRVNFYAHQRNTLELCEYIDEEIRASSKTWSPDLDVLPGRAEKQPRIAVLGGGIGGVTCFLGLRAKGYDNVFLFEAGPELLSVQQDCEHRHGHPGAADWPSLTTGAITTTDLPVLNWVPGTASSIISQMREDYILKYVNETLAKDYVFLNSPVTEIVAQNPPEIGAKGWRVTAPVDPRNTVFDIVVFALGFGNEKDVLSSRSDDYWWQDNIGHFMRERYRFKGADIVISGLGDGGLIDAARIAFNPAMRDDLAGPLIGAARDEMFHVPPQKPDDSDYAEVLSQFEQALQQACEVGKNEDLLEPLKVLVDRARVGEYGEDGRLATLLQAMIDSRDNQKSSDAMLCTLVGKGPFNLRRTIAQVNALLFAIANLKGEDGRPARIEYRQGQFDNDGIARLDIHDETLRDEPLEHAPGFGLHITGDQRLAFLKGIGAIGWDDEVEEETAAWDYRVRCIQRFADTLLLDARVRFRRDGDRNGYVEIKAPMMFDPKDENAPEKARRNYNAIMAIGGFDRTLYGVPVVYVDDSPQENAYRASTWYYKGEAS